MSSEKTLKTQETYTSVLSMVKKMYGSINPPYFLNAEQVINKLQSSSYAIGTQKIMAVVINSLLKEAPEHTTTEYTKAIDKYKEVITSYNNTINHLIGENIMNKKEEDKYIDYNELLEIHKQILEEYNKSNTSKLYFDYLLLSLYVLFPPRRLLDYTKMKLTNKENNNDNFNYLVYDKTNNKMKFIFNVYKTAKRYGKQTFDVPPQLRDIIKTYITLYQKGDFLLGNERNTDELNDDTMSKKMTRLLINYAGIPGGVSMIRHAYISHITDNSNLSLNDRKDVANKMAHSIFLQLQYYKKKRYDLVNDGSNKE